MADIAALAAALQEAEDAKTALLEERREKRESLSKSAFRAYNEDTRQQQIDTQKAVDDAQKELTLALNNARQDLLVGTLNESEKING